MRFQSEVSTLYKVILGLALLMLLVVSVASFMEGSDAASYVATGITLSIFIFIIWCALATYYTIQNGVLVAKSGPIVFRIKISSITKIENHNGILIPVMWKFGLSHNGLIITYNMFDDIYISPKNKEKFISEIQKKNHTIVISKK